MVMRSKVPVTVNYDQNKIVGEAEVSLDGKGNLVTDCSLTDQGLAEMLVEGSLNSVPSYTVTKKGTQTIAKINSVSLCVFVKEESQGLNVIDAYGTCACCLQYPCRCK